jgi:hypothetical protein
MLRSLNHFLGAISSWMVKSGIPSGVVFVLCGKNIKIGLKPSHSVLLLRHVFPSAVSIRYPSIASLVFRYLDAVETARFARHSI